MGKLTLNDDYKEAIKKISEGNPGALRVLFECYQKNFLIGQLVVTGCDEKKLYAWKVWDMYKDICGENLDKFIESVVPNIEEKLDTLKKLGIK